MVANAINDINWPQFSEGLDLLDFTQRSGVFTTLDFLASVFLELQRFYDHFVSLLQTFALFGILTDSRMSVQRLKDGNPW